jgi:hypothetical protein
MAKQRGQDRERIEVRDTFDRLAIAQHESVHVAPFGYGVADLRAKPKLNEHQVGVTAPMVDVSAEVWQA